VPNSEGTAVPSNEVWYSGDQGLTWLELIKTQSSASELPEISSQYSCAAIIPASASSSLLSVPSSTLVVYGGNFTINGTDTYQLGWNQGEIVALFSSSTGNEQSSGGSSAPPGDDSSDDMIVMIAIIIIAVIGLLLAAICYFVRRRSLASEQHEALMDDAEYGPSSTNSGTVPRYNTDL